MKGLARSKMATILIVFCIALVGAVVLWSLACAFPRPRIEVSATLNPYGRPAFRFKKNDRINYLSIFVFWQEGASKSSWMFDLRSPGPPVPPELVYGEVPAYAKQGYPPDDLPPEPLEVSRPFYMDVHYQYDTLFPPTASLGSQVFRFRIIDGRVQQLSLPKEIMRPSGS